MRCAADDGRVVIVMTIFMGASTVSSETLEVAESRGGVTLETDYQGWQGGE
jgi:hypothetical protein